MKPAPERSSVDRQWTRGSFAAAGFALFGLLYGLAIMLMSLGWPTDGWMLYSDSRDLDKIVLQQRYVAEPSSLQEGDQLVAINGQPVAKLTRAQQDFLNLRAPDWPDGTLLRYDVLRGGQPLALDVAVRRVSVWEYYHGALGRSSANWVQLATGVFFFLIGVIVFLLRPANRAAHALLFIGVGTLPLVVNDAAPTFFYPAPPVSIPFDTWTLWINPSLMYLVLAFPYPKAPLRRHPLLTVLLLYLTWPVLFNAAYLLHRTDWSGYREIAFAIYPIQVVLMMAVVLIAMVHTAVTVRDPVGRSQLKWMMVGIGSFVFLGVGGWLVSSYLFPETMTGGNWLTTAIAWLVLPICLAVAITRYRLFDIDVIIRRTLVYGALSVSLGLAYFGSVLVLQALFQTLIGQSHSPVVIVLSTLVIAALFTPLRARIQSTIDHRFYRRKYDAEQAVAAFSHQARNVVELEPLIGVLIEVVDKTMQPEEVSLWIKGNGVWSRTNTS